MNEKYQNKYRIPSARLQNWDYADNAAYFITICTKDRLHFFGEIDKIMEPTPIGKLAEQYWTEIPNHFSFVELGSFVVMPNHTHGILIINKTVETRQCLVSNIENIELNPEDVETRPIDIETRPIDIETRPIDVETRPIDIETRQCLVSTDGDDKSPSIGQKRFQNQGKDTISSIVGSYKSVVTKHAHKLDSTFQWQSRFYDHIIRDADSFNNIHQYIETNVANWEKDKFY